MSKGASWERWFCDRLSEWWTGEKGRRVFWRSSNSGGMATVRNKKGKQTKVHCGDVCAIDPVGQPLLDLITFELKRGYNARSIQDLLDSPTGGAEQLYAQWFQQAESSAANAGTPHWLLVVRRDRRSPVVFMTADFACLLESMVETFFCPYFCFQCPTHNADLIGITLEMFFAQVKPESLITIGREANAG